MWKLLSNATIRTVSSAPPSGTIGSRQRAQRGAYLRTKTDIWRILHAHMYTYWMRMQAFSRKRGSM